jgi:hypothetical protein
LGAKDIDAFASFRYTVYLEGKDECRKKKQK